MMYKAITLFSFFMLLAHGIEIVERKRSCRSNDLAKANRRFAYNLFHQIARENPDGNIFIAPLVVDMGLSMILEGAKGRTREELKEVLQLRSASLDKDGNDLGCFYKKFNEPEHPKLTTSAKMFGEKSLIFKTSFIDKTGSYAGNRFQNIDFASNPEKARNDINDWVSTNTNGKITELFSTGSISAMTKLVLASVLYFKGDWAIPFTSNSSSEFYLNYTTTVPVNMMREEMRTRYLYEQNLNAYLVELPYKSKEDGIEVSMILFLDLENPGFSRIEGMFDERTVESAIDKLLNEKQRKVEISLPMFDIKASYELKKTLRSMGLGSLFDQSADLSGMAETAQNLFVSTAVHETFLSIDKQGSEAAGAFGLGLIALSLPFGLRFDKPFHLMIYEKRTKSVLFMGRIANPNL